MMRNSASIAILVFFCFANADDALAWNTNNQRMIAAIVAHTLPEEVPSFLKTTEAGRQVGEVSREPDRVKNNSADAAHYVLIGDDLKILRGPALSMLPANRESYDSALRAAGTNEYRAGYLPYVIADAWQQLVTDFAYWRADVAGVKYARTPSEQSFFFQDSHLREGLTVRDLGYLAHFVGDGAEPLNVTVHRDGWGNFPNPVGFEPGKGILPRFEAAGVRNQLTQKDVLAQLNPYRDCRCDILKRIADYLGATQKDVTQLYRIDKTGGLNGEAAKILVLRRLSMATAELRDLIVDAWRKSAEASIGSPPLALRDVESGRANVFPSLIGNN